MYMPPCLGTGEYIWRLILAFIVFWFGLIVFMVARKGKARFQGVSRPENAKLLATAISVIAWMAALLTLGSTLFGWGC
jgi:hypothetical protein